MLSTTITMVNELSRMELITSLVVIGFLTWLIYYFLIQRQGQPPLQHNPAENLSQDELQKRVASAATSRLIMANKQEKSSGSKAKNKRTRTTSTISTTTTKKEKNKIDDSCLDSKHKQQGMVSKKKNHPPKKEKNNTKTTNTKMIRKATHVDQIKWNEERTSQNQFGFSIYGHEAASSCCGTSSSSSQNHHHYPSTMALSSFGNRFHSISEIQHLPGNDVALSLLQQLAREFEPVLQKRGWTVLALTEMCCCGDGDEYLKTNERTSRNNETNSTQSPTDHTTTSDTLGYCISRNDNRCALGIHIRLRPPWSCKGSFCTFYPYNDLVLTMAHELAHIAIGPHNHEFFQLMKDIENERAQCMANGLTVGEDGFPFTTTGRRLGTTKKRSTKSNSIAIGRKELKKRVGQAAAARQQHQKQKPQRNETKKLTGTPRNDNSNSNENAQDCSQGYENNEVIADLKEYTKNKELHEGNDEKESLKEEMWL